MEAYNPDHKRILDQMLLADPRVWPGRSHEVRAGKMFGLPAYYVGKKLFASLYENGIGIKLPAERAARLLESDPNVEPFMPLGRPKMREWVQITLERSEEFERYLPVFEESIRYVYELSTAAGGETPGQSSEKE